MQWVRDQLAKCWGWIATGGAALVLLATVYFAGRSKRKGDIDLAVATHELDRANKAHDEATAKVVQIKEKQVRLVGDILAEQLRRAEEEKKRANLTDAEIDERLRARGLLLDDAKPK